jgi:hypothetical protein
MERGIPGKFQRFFKRLHKSRVPCRITFLIIGLMSTAWFLIRVIPKPTRAGYPCMRVAAPLMSSFVVYLISLTGSVFLFRRARRFLYQYRFVAAALAFLGSIVIFMASSALDSYKASAVDGNSPEDFIVNQPYGEGLGIFPGRVVWAWNPDATDENCTNTKDDAVRGEDGYFLAQNYSQAVIDSMLDDVVMNLTGTYRVKAAWDSLFTDLNRRKGIGEVSYTSGQKIFVKINQGGAGWTTDPTDLSFGKLNWQQQYYGMSETSPGVVISLLDQLVNECGIAQEDIYVGDPIAHIYKYNYDQFVALFPDVKYIDKSHFDLGRTLISKSAEPSIFWSDKGTVMPGAVRDTLYAEMENADYMINVAALKAHARAGITLTTKNHFGSHTRDAASHLHPALIAPENDQPVNTSYGMYRVLTDIMGHEKLGGNTVLFIVDGLWSGTEAVEKPIKWDMFPFSGDWPNSIFASQDQVALESVCFDFLRNEFTDPEALHKARPWMGAVDDHMHQAADSSFWPDGIIYDPENDGTPIGSLGVHEHWNNMFDRQYSRNLGFDYGIELYTTNKALIKSTVMAKETRKAPVFDGEGLDSCWQEAGWNYIDQTWITWGQTIDSSDYSGRFKVSWSETENLLFFYVEVTDDAFVDGYVFPDEGYPDFDIVEVFLDEDHSGGLHVFDDNAEWGANSENAFSYHLALDAPADGNTVTDFVAADIDGTSWSDNIIIDYAAHFPDLAMKKDGNIYRYEFSLRVYDDGYDHADPEASRVALTAGKVMGMSMAYCDNDQPDGERDNFFGSVWVPEEAYNDHWMNADGYGTLRLVTKGTKLNQPPAIKGSIPDFEVSAADTLLSIVGGVSGLFEDPDGDSLILTVECTEALLSFMILNDTLWVMANPVFSGDCSVKLIASDGQSQVYHEFVVSRDVTGTGQELSDILSLHVFPNPFKDFFQVELGIDPGYYEQVLIEVFDLSGKQLRSEVFDFSDSGIQRHRIDMADVPQGVYILTVRTGTITKSALVTKNSW